MNINVEIEKLKAMKVKDLREKYLEIFKETTNSRHKAYLIKRIAWRMQANLEGDLSERAKQRALELANDADLRVRPPKKQLKANIPHPVDRTAVHKFVVDDRLPMPGSVLTRPYKGKMIIAKVLEEGFEYDGKFFKSLSAVAKAATGSQWNGYYFFGLNKKGKNK